MAAASIASAESEEPDIATAADSPWTKVCLGEACYVSKGRYAYCGLIAEVALVERKTEAGQLLNIGLSMRINPEHQIRLTIDRNGPVTRPISKCDVRGCWADYESGPELVDQLKQGQMLVLEAVNRDNSPHTVTIPLAGFAKAYDGPPMPMPVMQERILSKAEMNALREQDQRAKDERGRRCGLP